MGRKTSKEELAKIGAKTRFKAGAQQAKIASQGGIASGIAKREKRTMREIAEIILSKDVTTSDGVVTGKYAVLAKVMEKALKGDLQAATFIRDTIGEKPTEKTQTELTLTQALVEFVDGKGDDKDSGEVPPAVN